MEIERSRPSQPSAGAQEAPKTGSKSEDAAYWEGLEHTEEFRQLVSARLRFVLPATVLFLVYYFLLPLLNGLAPSFMRTDVVGHVNIAYLFALSQFVMAWVVMGLYVRRARAFDAMEHEIVARHERGAA